MKIIGTDNPDVLVLEPRVFPDERGFFLEAWNARIFRNETKLDMQFVEDNHSRSTRNVLRGLHYQIRQPQGKLVRVARGRIFDVAVDLRAYAGLAAMFPLVGITFANSILRIVFARSFLDLPRSPIILIVSFSLARTKRANSSAVIKSLRARSLSKVYN